MPIIKLYHYTVIILRPDGYSSYQNRVEATDPKDAVVKTHQFFIKEEKMTLSDITKCMVIAVYAGWHDDIRPTMINGLPV